MMATTFPAMPLPISQLNRWDPIESLSQLLQSLDGLGFWKNGTVLKSYSLPTTYPSRSTETDTWTCRRRSVLYPDLYAYLV